MLLCMVFKSQFIPRKDIQDRVRLLSSVRSLLPGSENIGGVSIEWTEFTVYTFAEVTDVSGLGVSYPPDNFDGISRGLVWLGVPFPWTEFVLQCKVWWMLARSPSSPKNQVDGELTVGCGEWRVLHGSFRVHELGKHQLLAR